VNRVIWVIRIIRAIRVIQITKMGWTGLISKLGIESYEGC
jgi:hypothetical protein